jgi:diacylglycerol kinase family enzyme
MGRGRNLVDELVAQIKRKGLSTEIAWTPEARSALVRAAALNHNCRCLVAVGGDGTVSALLNDQPGTPITVLPAGTENLFARHFGLRRDPETLARTIATGRAVAVDVGQAGSRRFLLMAGFGFDADVVTRHHQARLSRSGRIRPTHRIAYVEPILRSSLTYRFPAISVRIDDPGHQEVLRGTTIFVFNLPRYALGLPFAPVAREDDGWLDLVVFRNPGPFHALYYLWKVCCGIHLDDPSVFHRRIRRVTIWADEPVPVQLDGDPGGYLRPAAEKTPEQDRRSDRPSDRVPHERPTPAATRYAQWTVQILPAAVEVLAPAGPGGCPAQAPLASDGVA